MQSLINSGEKNPLIPEPWKNFWKSLSFNQKETVSCI